MKYLTAKFLAGSLLVLGSYSQATIDPTNPSWGWDDYKQLKCQDGYNKVLNYCVKCDEKSGKVFDSVTKQCRKCPDGTKYDTIKQSCECQCTGGRTFLNNQCVCPTQKPLWNGKTCVTCPPGTTFQPKDKQCYKCPEGFAADPITHLCSPGL